MTAWAIFSDISDKFDEKLREANRILQLSSNDVLPVVKLGGFLGEQQARVWCEDFRVKCEIMPSAYKHGDIVADASTNVKEFEYWGSAFRVAFLMAVADLLMKRDKEKYNAHEIVRELTKYLLAEKMVCGSY